MSTTTEYYILVKKDTSGKFEIVDKVNGGSINSTHTPSKLITDPNSIDVYFNIKVIPGGTGQNSFTVNGKDYALDLNTVYSTGTLSNQHQISDSTSFDLMASATTSTPITAPASTTPPNSNSASSNGSQIASTSQNQINTSQSTQASNGVVVANQGLASNTNGSQATTTSQNQINTSQSTQASNGVVVANQGLASNTNGSQVALPPPPPPAPELSVILAKLLDSANDYDEFKIKITDSINNNTDADSLGTYNTTTNNKFEFSDIEFIDNINDTDPTTTIFVINEDKGEKISKKNDEYKLIGSNQNKNLFLYIWTKTTFQGGQKQKQRKSKRNYSKKQRKHWAKNNTLRNYYNY